MQDGPKKVSDTREKLFGQSPRKNEVLNFSEKLFRSNLSPGHLECSFDSTNENKFAQSAQKI